MSRSDPADMTPTRTSVHGLNADRPLTTAGKIAYFALNWLNNRRPYSLLDPGLTVRDFTCPALETYRDRLTPGASPSRALCDLFWMTLPWTAIQEDLGAIHVLDVGCGKGGYGPRLIEWTGNRIAIY